MNAAGRRAAGPTLTPLIWVVVLMTLSPLVWLVSTSFKNRVDAFAMPPPLWFEPILENFRSVLG